MMIEMRHVRQDSPDLRRHWYFDDNFDLIVWYRPDGSLFGFQLCYDKALDDEKALTWLATRGLSHHKVDTGEESPWTNRTPMLTESEGRSGMAKLLSRFGSASEGLPVELKTLVEQKIREYGLLPTPLLRWLKWLRSLSPRENNTPQEPALTAWLSFPFPSLAPSSLRYLPVATALRMLATIVTIMIVATYIAGVIDPKFSTRALFLQPKRRCPL
jgi:hypothetical protein